MSKLTGKLHELTFGSQLVRTTKCSLKIAKETAESTDSSDYDATTELFHKSQLAHSAQVELAVEGYFYNVNGATGTIATVLLACYAGDSLAAGTINIDGTNALATGKWDITDFEADIDNTATVTFKCTLKSNGKITFTDVPA
jgi:predicted secreted protein